MTLEQILLLALVFVAVVAATLGVAQLATRRSALQQRVQAWRSDMAAAPPAGSRARRWLARFVRTTAPVARLATPDDGEGTTLIRKRMLHAGVRDPQAPLAYYATKAMLALILPVLLLTLLALLDAMPRIEGLKALEVVLVPAALGYYLPDLTLSWAVQRRQRALFEAFPDAIDLMIVCVEAGLGMDAAINRAATEIRLRSPVLAEELDFVAMELRVGASRERALRNLAARTGLEDVSTFVSMLLQTDRFGTSLAQSLRVHADGLRTRRQTIAEEAASKIPLKLLFPLIYCIFPALLLVLLGPAFLQIKRTLLPALNAS